MTDSKAQPSAALTAPECIVLMGVSGTGKSTVAELLTKRLGWRFVEGDDLHPPANIFKMSHCHPLNDQDRAAWLQAISDTLTKAHADRERIIITCSALKLAYRENFLTIHPGVQLFLLHAPATVLAERLKARQAKAEHFFPASLLQSQIDTLEWPGPAEHVVVLDTRLKPEELAYLVEINLGKRPEDLDTGVS